MAANTTKCVCFQVLDPSYLCHSSQSLPTISMERHLPLAHTSVRARTRELLVPQPEHSVHAARTGILDRDVLHGLGHAPHVDMRIERARRAVLPVRGPRERVDAPAVERPARRHRLALRGVVQHDLAGGLCA